MRPQAVFEPHFLDFEIELQSLDLLRKRHLGRRFIDQSVTEKGREPREHRIRVSVICPGSTATELSPHHGRDTSRMLQPEDVAHIARMIVTQAPQSFASEIVLRPTQKP